MKKSDRKPSFLWQGVLILLPIAILVAVGVVTISRDRRAAQNEATDRAREAAEEAATLVWNALVDPSLLQKPSPNPPGGAFLIVAHGDWLDTNAPPSARNQVVVDRAGNLLQPPGYDPTPAPRSLNVDELSQGQRDLWLRANAAASARDRITHLEAFLKDNAPPAFTAEARFALGVAKLGAEDYTGAIAEFTTVTNRFSNSVSEAGLPLNTLARIKLIEAEQRRGKLTGDAMSSAVRELAAHLLAAPTVLTRAVLSPGRRPAIHEEIRARADAEWQRHEQLREVHAAVLPLLQKQLGAAQLRFASVSNSALPFAQQASAHWVTVSKTVLGTNDTLAWMTFEDRWLVLMTPTASGATLSCHPTSGLEAMVKAALDRVWMPPYFGAAVSIAGSDIIAATDLVIWERLKGGKGAGEFIRRSKTPLHRPPALASFTHTEGGTALVKADVYLTAPDLLYAQQQRRTVGLITVMFAAAVTAFIGFFSARRAFNRQLRLADMKANFVSSVSHELRAPIASVRLMAEGLERGKVTDPTKQREYFRFITQECRRLSSMIENVLDFARIDQGRKEYDLEPTDLAALVEQTVKVMEPYAAERGVQLVLERMQARDSWAAPNDQAAVASPFIANVDGQAIQQALVNLIDNAIKHSPSGESVVVTLRESDKQPVSGTADGDTVQLSVLDRGPGIPENEQQRIFERFYRLGSELRRETPGVGIGLSIVKHIVEAHHGTVSVQSAPGKGSRFTIELPLPPKEEFTTDVTKENELA